MAMQKRHLIFSLLSILVFLTIADNAFARPRDRSRDRDRGRHHYQKGFNQRGFRYTPPVYRGVLIWPSQRILIGPTIVVAAAPAPMVVSRVETIMVWITNFNGSKSAVTLTKDMYGPGYIGPRGEYYTTMPTEEQLRPVYGLQ
jgi:hypothetical protein